MATNNEYKIISSKGKGLATGDAAAANEARLTSDADFRASELERTNQVIADRKAAGADVSQQEAYLGRINQLNAAQPVQETDPYQTLIDLSVKYQNEQTEAFTASQEAALKAQQSQIEGTYADAVAEQERLKTQAGESYEGQLEQIDESRYRETERGRIVGEQRGIGSSAQFQALQQGVVSRAGQKKLDAATNRDRIISDLSQRIAQLGLQKGRDLATAQALSDQAIAQGRADIAAQGFNQQLGLMGQRLGREQQLEDIASQREYQTGEREAAQQYQTSEREAQNEFASLEAALGRKFTAEQNQLNRDLQAYMQQAGFAHDVNMFEKSSFLQRNLLKLQNNYAIAADNRKLEQTKQLESWRRDEEVAHALAQVTEGTDEHKALEGMIQYEREQLEMRAAVNQDWAEKWADYEVMLADEQARKDLDARLALEDPNSEEYRAAMAEYEIQKRAMTDEITNQAYADATANYLAQDPVFAENSTGFLQALKNGYTEANSFAAELFSFGFHDANEFKQQMRKWGFYDKLSGIEEEARMDFAMLEKQYKYGSMSQETYNNWKRDLQTKYKDVYVDMNEIKNMYIDYPEGME